MATRRTVLKATLAAGAASVFSGVLGGMGAALAQNAPRVRRSLHGMALDDPDLSAYREFVRIMQAQDQTKPVSWLQYSLMHGRYGGGYRYCPHGDWYFLPWHRAFVLMYENAVRKLVGKSDFAMPYWDWTVDRIMPSSFTDTSYQGKPNPFYVPGRTLDTGNWPLPDAWVGPEVMANNVYRETAFPLFGTSRNPAQNDLDMSWVVRGGGSQGFLERTPHNLIHNSIGAFMPSAGSPRDPIFMMHHSNIDRIWANWNALGRSNLSGMSAAEQKLFLNINFKDNYLTPSGGLYGAYSRDMQSIATLGYTYTGMPAPDNRKADPERTQRLLSLFATGSTIESLDSVQMLASINTQAATIREPLVKQAHLPSSLQSMVIERDPEQADAAEVFALIKEIEFAPGVSSVRVFVNADDLSVDTPDSDPHFVTEIGFLAHEPHADHGKVAPSALVDLTGTLRNLASLGMLKGDRISVHLLPSLREGASNGDATVVPAVVEIAVL